MADETNAEGEFYIVDMRAEWSRKPYVTVWRPDNCGYAFPLSWAGLYSKEQVDAEPSYYATKQGTRQWKRFPVPAHVVRGLAIPTPERGIIDGDTGPVLRNNVHIRDALRRARYIPEGADNAL